MKNKIVPGPELSKLIAAARIKHLYWIDDEFGASDMQVAGLLAGKVQTLWSLSDNEVLLHPLLSSIVPGSAPEFIESSLLALLIERRTSDISRELIESVDKQIARHDSTHEVGVKDLSPGQFAEIAAAFAAASAKVERLSLNRWIEQMEIIRSQVGPDCVFFVDHDFSREEGGSSLTGEEILRTLFSFEQKTFTCILFTHGTDREKQAEKRTEIAGRLGLDQIEHRFSVVSKENLTEAGFDSDYSALTDAFKAAFVRDWCYNIAQEFANVFAASFADTKKALLGLSFEDVAAAFFRKPINDGALEFDVLLRVLTLSARVKLEDDRPSHTIIWSQLSRIRNVLAESPSETVAKAFPETLRRWRQRELFDPGEVVNQMFSPPSLGDVFSIANKTKTSYFVLIGQPCDLAVRSTGLRKSGEAIFLPILTKPPKQKGFAYEFEFPGFGERWISYEDPIAVNLNLLDLVSFGDDGHLAFHSNVKTSDMMLPGVKKKFDQFKRSFEGIQFKDGKQTTSLNQKYLRLTCNGAIPGTETDIKNGQIKMGVSRIGRVRSPYSEAILGGFAIHHTRRAFDFDFSDLSQYVDEPEATAGG